MADRERRTGSGRDEGARERARNIARGVSPSMAAALQAIERAATSSAEALLRIQTWQQRAALVPPKASAVRALIKLDPKRDR